LSLASTIAQGQFDSPKRIGCYSYGSGCCSEFFSGVITAQGQDRVLNLGIEEQLNQRYQLSMDEYDVLLRDSSVVKFGTRNVELDFQLIPGALTSSQGKQRLYLDKIREFHREYRWI
jgi:polyketide biosynthesis 3-hydroxy-3-methylglutaryl-CoA synthase-like enzyme PksG